jgi:pimeloyl-ACP methyl ester carboxylesterase
MTAHDAMEPRALTYEITGEGDPVVLVSGGLTGRLSWIPHAERLSTSWKTIRVQPIHNELGSAGQPGDLSYTAETERESLRLTLDALGIERAHFAGWSGGGRADRVRARLPRACMDAFLEGFNKHLISQSPKPASA